MKRADDPRLGFDEAVFEMSVDPDEIAGDEKLMAELDERKEMLEGYYESFCEQRAIRAAGNLETAWGNGFTSHDGERRINQKW